MSELQNVMERFRIALRAVQKRIEEAEARPERAELEALKQNREEDLKKFEQLKAELQALQKDK